MFASELPTPKARFLFQTFVQKAKMCDFGSYAPFACAQQQRPNVQNASVLSHKQIKMSQLVDLDSYG